MSEQFKVEYTTEIEEHYSDEDEGYTETFRFLCPVCEDKLFYDSSEVEKGETINCYCCDTDFEVSGLNEDDCFIDLNKREEG